MFFVFKFFTFQFVFCISIRLLQVLKTDYFNSRRGSPYDYATELARERERQRRERE